MERTYYTLDDIRKEVGGSYLAAKGPYAMMSKTFVSFINDCLLTAGYDAAPTLSETNESISCFRNYIWPRFYQEAIIYVDSDESEDFLEKFCRTKAGQIMS